MPSFDIVSEINDHEVSNSVDQANRELANRFDFKGTDSHIDLNDDKAILITESEFQLGQMLDVLRNKMTKRGVDIACLEIGEPEASGKTARQELVFRQGLDADLARKIVKNIKSSKLKVQSTIQGDKVRITGKKRDDLQQVIALLRSEKFDLPLQFNNFRD